MVRVRTKVAVLAVELTPGGESRFGRDEEFECPVEKAKQLGNSVLILPDQDPEPPGKKRG